MTAEEKEKSEEYPVCIKTTKKSEICFSNEQNLIRFSVLQAKTQTQLTCTPNDFVDGSMEKR